MQQDLDPVIADRFASECRRKQYLARFEGLIDELGRKQSVPAPLKNRARELIAELRTQLARGERGDAGAGSGRSWTNSSASGTSSTWNVAARQRS